MTKPERIDLRKIVTVGGSYATLLNPGQLLKMGWTKGSYVWVKYYPDKIEIIKNNDQIQQRGKN